MLRMATHNDLDGIAALHTKCFSEYFLTKLGNNLLSKYYKEFMTSDDIVIVYTDEDDKIVGLLVGTPASSTGRNNFIKHNFVSVFFKILLLCVKFDKDTWDRVLAFLKLHLKNNKNVHDSSNCCKGKEMRLLSICVSDDYKGRSVAESLVIEFEESLRLLGYDSYALTVFKSNLRANNFYMKMGMTVKKETNSEYEYKKEL